MNLLATYQNVTVYGTFSVALVQQLKECVGLNFSLFSTGTYFISIGSLPLVLEQPAFESLGVYGFYAIKRDSYSFK